MYWFVANLERVIERLQSMSHFEFMQTLQMFSWKFEDNAKIVLDVNDELKSKIVNEIENFHCARKFNLCAINFAFACNHCATNIDSNIVKLTTIECLTMHAMYAMFEFAKQRCWEKCCETSFEKRLHCLSLVDVRKLENDLANDATIDLKASTTFNYLSDCFMKVKSETKIAFEIMKIAKVERHKRIANLFLYSTTSYTIVCEFWIVDWEIHSRNS